MVFQIIFLILTSTNLLKPTSTLTYADIKSGIPSLIICVQTSLFAMSFHYAYNVSEYSSSPKESLISNQEHGPDEGYGNKPPYSELPPYEARMGFFRAWLAVLDPREILSAIKFIFTMRSQAEMGTTFDTGYGGNVGLEPLRRNRDSY
jgi:hypothetical protein